MLTVTYVPLMLSICFTNIDVIDLIYVCRLNSSKMKGTNIGELEELILLVVGVLYDGAYGVSVLKEIKDQTGREVNISAIHAVMNRLEDKGYLKSEMGGSSSTRGGRRKRNYYLTAGGRQALDQIRSVREKLYSQLSPAGSYQFTT